MTQPTPTPETDARELILTRLIPVPAAKLYRCWTEAVLLPEWFCPKPWTVSHAELDVRPGGGSTIIMRGPDGTEMPNHGIYLDLVPNERIVFTDAYTAGWVPSAKPYFTGIITFEEENGQTRYTARARHWTVEDAEAHAEMGFHEGWGLATDQLAALAATL